MGDSMSAIVLSGDTSGTITLDAPAVAGTNTLTLPATTGTIVTTGNPQSGSVLQVVQTVQSTSSAFFTTTSTSLVATGLSVIITPKFSTSKVLITANAIAQNNQGQYAIMGSIFRGATNLATGTAPAVLYYGRLGASTASLVNTMSMQYLDSPATTSATTYQVYIAVESGGTAYFGATVGGAGSNNLVITATEIAA